MSSKLMTVSALQGKQGGRYPALDDVTRLAYFKSIAHRLNTNELQRRENLYNLRQGQGAAAFIRLDSVACDGDGGV